ncbi:LysR family transcriptional regulator [Paenibacillus sp. NPDC057967]|uniref:LysR family transcriptional regulator n=1 Tax=Paenibacillus sp. NPDC057967 TaxID=3346293 RepID=UPI0036DE48B6
MDIRQLRYFIAIVEEGTVSAAAKRLHLSQPPLSQQLKAMEEELSTVLMERSGKYLKLTAAGKKLYDYALQMVELIEEAASEVKEVGQGSSGTLALGVNTLSVAELPDLLHRFRETYPKAAYHIQQSESVRLCQLVRERAVELAFIRLPLDLGDDLAVHHLYSEPFYVVTSAEASQPAPQDAGVSLAELQDIPLMLPSTPGLGVHYLIRQAFSELHLQPNIVGDCSDISLLIRLVESGFCSAIVPETLLKVHDRAAIQANQITSPSEMTAPVGLVWLKNRRLSALAENFIQLYTS